MPTVIRMKRGGRTHAPYYRIVVMDSRARSQGREIDQLGVYHPAARPKPVIEVNKKKALEWLYKGAQCSDTARTVLTKHGVLKAFAEGLNPEVFAEPVPAPEVPIEEPVAVAAEPEVEAVVEAPVVEAPAVEAPVAEVPEIDAAPATQEEE